MGGLFDLFGEPDEGEKGNNTLDLLDLAPNSRKVLRIILRNGSMYADEVCRAVERLPEEDRLTAAEVHEILTTLCTENWLTPLTKEQQVFYRANIRRKGSNEAGSLSRARRVPPGIWDALDFESESTRNAGNPTDLPSDSPKDDAPRKKGIWDALNFDDQHDKG